MTACPLRDSQENPMTDSPYDPDLDAALDEEWEPPHPEFPYLSTDSVLAWLDDGAQRGSTFDARRRCKDAAALLRRLLATVEAQAGELADARAVIRRLLDWWTPHYVGDEVDSWYRDSDDFTKEVWEGITDGEAAAFARARSIPGGDT